MKPLARIVFRNSGEIEDGLIIGVKLKNGKGVFSGGDVWEIYECLDTLQLRKVGKSCIGKTGNETLIEGVSWMQDISHILSCAHPYTFLTDNEFKKAINKRT